MGKTSSSPPRWASPTCAGSKATTFTNGVIATAKHFLGYGVSEGALNAAASVASGRDLYDVCATPFEAMIKEAGLASVMNFYSDIDGVPAGANRQILSDLLRGRMGFTGSVVSDYGTVEQLVTRQKIAATPQQAGILAPSCAARRPSFAAMNSQPSDPAPSC
ncbi:glycoside hydrolase family 3 N-terminal domain-containing protein [Arthrobacter sp. NPDC056691]|uniref:glycoside hydrolase family 3 N-terminal domain-containing protein n=1 Tax=Arthrobacter sp. NPDC056691 TaxID=3345913 RepID=UPI0036715C4C